jgi:hypothetical protein
MDQNKADIPVSNNFLYIYLLAQIFMNTSIYTMAYDLNDNPADGNCMPNHGDDQDVASVVRKLYFDGVQQSENI